MKHVCLLLYVMILSICMTGCVSTTQTELYAPSFADHTNTISSAIKMESNASEHPDVTSSQADFQISSGSLDDNNPYNNFVNSSVKQLDEILDLSSISTVEFWDEKEEIMLRLWNDTLMDYDDLILDAKTLEVKKRIVRTQDYLLESKSTWIRSRSDEIFYAGELLSIPHYSHRIAKTLAKNQTNFVYTNENKTQLFCYDFALNKLAKSLDTILIPEIDATKTIYCTKMEELSPDFLLLYFMQDVATGTKLVFISPNSSDLKIVPLDYESNPIQTISTSADPAKLFHTEFSSNGQYAVTYEQMENHTIDFQVYHCESKEIQFNFSIHKSSLPDWNQVYPTRQSLYLSNDGNRVLLAYENHCIYIQNTQEFI